MLERVWLGVCYVLAGIVSLVWLTLSHALAAPSFPALSGRVVDEAGILSDDTKQTLSGMLAGDQLQGEGRQVVVVTLSSLQGYTIEDYGYQLGRAWGIGQKGKDNGILVIVAPHEHKSRIEVGYGLEGALTDAQSRIILERYMLPAFRHNDYDAGVTAGTKAVLETLGNKTLSPPPEQYQRRVRQRDDDDDPPIGFIIFMVILVLVFHGGRFLWPFFFFGGFGGGRGGWGGGSWGGGGGGWSSGGGGGGFSGGGGSFGGGGASGSW
jgi:uncharacterized protein